MMDKQHRTGPIRKARVRTGCLTCRARKVKCDEQRPLCFNCVRLDRACFYEELPVEYRSFPHASSTMVSFDDVSISDVGGITNIFDSTTAPGSASQAVIPAEESKPSPSEVSLSLEAMAGEWGDLFSADLFQLEALQPSAQNTPQDGLVDSLPPSTSGPQFQYFVNCVQPPFILPWDQSNWVTAKTEIALLATSSQTIATAIAAVENLYSVFKETGDIAKSLPAYFAAKSAYILAISSSQLNTDQLFVTVLLLCCFEVVAQQETISSTLKQKDILISTLEQRTSEKPWSPLTQRIIIWLHLFHAKALHLGGRGILSPNLLMVLEDQQNTTLCIPSASRNAQGNRNIAVHSLRQSLFRFYFELQHVSIMAASMNRHHRLRGSHGDELQVDNMSNVIERRLQSLWQGYSWILECSNSDVMSAVICSEQDQTDIMCLVRLCELSYHAEVIYYARSHGRANMSSEEVQPARTAIRKILCAEDSQILLRQPAVAWPLFLYSVESRCADEVIWALCQFDLIQNPLWHTDFIRTFIRDLTAEQLQKADRVDSRLFCVEKYGIVPPFL